MGCLGLWGHITYPVRLIWYGVKKARPVLHEVPCLKGVVAGLHARGKSCSRRAGLIARLRRRGLLCAAAQEN